MEIFGEYGQLGAVFLLLVIAGVIIYATSTWVGEALLTQIRSNKTSVFGRSEEYSNAKTRTIYVPPAQVNTITRATPTFKPLEKTVGKTLPPIPVRVPKV